MVKNVTVETTATLNSGNKEMSTSQCDQNLGLELGLRQLLRSRFSNVMRQ